MRMTISALICVLALTNTPVFAETVYLPLGQQGANKQAISRPQQGMTKEQVKQTYGEPIEWRPAVGEPPISSWVYADFTVYFEYEYVIHSVLSHQPIGE
jgi:hypothetical protein